MYLCTCNNCGGIFEDTNPQPSGNNASIKYLWKNEMLSRIMLEPLSDHSCPVCESDGDLVDNINMPALNELTKEMAEMFIALPTAIQEAVKRKISPTSLVAKEVYAHLEFITSHIQNGYKHDYICNDFDYQIYILFQNWYNQPQK